MKIKIINGPNLNMLGIREKNIYGGQNYEQMCEYIVHKTQQLDVDIDFFQSNSEGAIIDCLHSCFFEKYDGVVINPAAYTHYSYAIMDAIKAIQIPTIEVHISDIKSRESFRQVSVTSLACVKQICGQSFDGYANAIKCLVEGDYEKTI